MPDPSQSELAETARAIRQSLELHKRGTREIRFFELRDLFGIKTWSGSRKAMVAKALAGQGIRANPPVTSLSLNDWLVLSLAKKVRDLDVDQAAT